MGKIIENLEKDIQKYLNSENDWMRSKFEVTEAKDYAEFIKMVSDFCEKIPTPKFHDRRKENDRLIFHGQNSMITIYFKFIIPETAVKIVSSVNGIYEISCL